MSRLVKLYRNPRHALLENTDFILRLRFKKKGSVPQKADHVNLFRQYLSLYEAMEARLKRDGRNELLAFFCQTPWLHRCDDLRNDLIEMTNLLTKVEKQALLQKDYILPAVKKMCQAINEGDIITYFAMLTIRCLGDVFGGQKLNQYSQRVFDKNSLRGEFYQNVLSQKVSLMKWINHVTLTPVQEALFFQKVDLFFQYHIELFEQMEDARGQLAKSMLVCPSKKYARLAFFGATFLTGAAIGVGYYLHSNTRVR